ncbi:MAG: hypothetical protein MUC81_05040 [Bacteroidia bacterium]|jgi:hypothetical protein|nr:hypothetical protein [Bacteroidia bacterium]
MKSKHVIRITLLTLVVLVMIACSSSKKGGMKNMVARMQVKSPIDGVCDNNNVIVILPIPGNAQQKALPPITFQELANLLNEKLSFLKDNPTYTAKGYINVIINCKGEMVQCLANSKDLDEKLNKELETLIGEFKQWKPATVQNKIVDSMQLISIEVNQGRLAIK